MAQRLRAALPPPRRGRAGPARGRARDRRRRARGRPRADGGRAGRRGDDRPLASLADAPGRRQLRNAEVVGDRSPGRGAGAALPRAAPARRRAARAARRVGATRRARAVGRRSCDAGAANPDWLRLDGRTVVVLGAGAEMGPLGPLLRWGATVAAVDLPTSGIWERVLRTARAGAGRLLLPVPADGDLEDRELAGAAGVDLLAEVPEVATWLAGLHGRLVVGQLPLRRRRHPRAGLGGGRRPGRAGSAASGPTSALAFLATPTDVFAVPREAVEQSARAYAERSRAGKLVGRPLRWASRGRLLHRAYRPTPTRGSATAWCRCRGRATRWPSASSAGVRRPPALPGGGLAARRALDPHPLGREEPRARRRLRRRPPVRRGGVRPRHGQHADGRPARPRPRRRRSRPRAPLAGRGVRRGARRPVARGVRAAQRPRSRRDARLRERARLGGACRCDVRSGPRAQSPAARRGGTSHRRPPSSRARVRRRAARSRLGGPRVRRPMSTDHDWGPRLLLFLGERDLEAGAARSCAARCRHARRRPVELEVRRYATGSATSSPSTSPGGRGGGWLTLPEHVLATVVAGEVFHDDVGLGQVRDRRVVPAGHVALCWPPAGGGSPGGGPGRPHQPRRRRPRLGAGRVTLVTEIMRLCFLIERRYRRTPKSFGSAFFRLENRPDLMRR